MSTSFQKTSSNLFIRFRFCRFVGFADLFGLFGWGFIYGGNFLQKVSPGPLSKNFNIFSIRHSQRYFNGIDAPQRGDRRRIGEGAY
jgi:hypothetical protein